MRNARLPDPPDLSPRSRTVLNGNKAVLMAGAGCELLIAQDEAGVDRIPERVQAFPIDQFYEVWEYDFVKDKFNKVRIKTSLEYLQQVAAGTLEVWGNRKLPFFRHHNSYTEASGWFQVASIEVDAEGLWVYPEWVGDTESLIAQRKYRYLSPGWYHTRERVDPATGKPAPPHLSEISLTNHPYFRQQSGLAAGDNSLTIMAAMPVAANQEVDMDLTKIRELLKLSADATEEEVQSAIEAAASNGAALAEITTALNLQEGQTAAARIAELTAAAESPEADEPETPAQEPEPETPPAPMGETVAGVMAEAACAAGKYPPGEVAKLSAALAKLSVADAQSLIAGLPSTPPGKTTLKDKAKAGDGKTLDVPKRMLAQCGMSAEDYLKYSRVGLDEENDENEDDE